MINGYLFGFGLLLGGMASPYIIRAFHSAEKKLHDHFQSQPLDCVYLRAYVSPYTGKREVPDILDASRDVNCAGYKPYSLEGVGND